MDRFIAFPACSNHGAMKFLPLVLVLLGPLFPPAHAAVPDDVGARLRRLTPFQVDEVLWLARCIYSESDRPEEQRLVAWVVRNRVETQYRGDTYREVVLEAKQFSAFNAPSPRRDHILSLQPDTPLPAWREALRIALDVYLAPSGDRPFAVETRHFYSPVSMVGRSQPTWADDAAPLSSQRLGVDPNRFQFFAGIDPELAGMPTALVAAPERSEARLGHTRTSRGLSRTKLRTGGVVRPQRPVVRRPNE